MPAPVLFDSKTGIHLSFPQPEDGADLFAAVRESISDISRWMDWCHPGYQEEETELWIKQLPDQWKARENFAFIIRDRFNRAVGTCGLSHPNWQHRFANLGYWVRTGETGKGYAPAAAKLVASWGFRELELNRIEIIMAVENKNSRRVAEKTGATYEGILRSRLQVCGGAYDAHSYSLIPTDLAQPSSHGA